MMFRFCAILPVALVGVLPLCAGNEAVESGWGIDAILTCAVKPEAVPEWLSLVKQSDVRFLRERWTTAHSLDPRQPDFRPVYAMEKAAGFRVLAFGINVAPLPEVENPGGASRDLNAVYNEGRRIGREFADYVDVWELHNEPDVGYFPDMPDRYVAHAKALYLGLKAGAREAGRDTPVILGALALPPGVWLERAARNGVLNYADAYNFHYYGHPDELASVIDAHRVAQEELSDRGGGTARRPGAPAIASPWPGAGRWREQASAPRVMPMWITECGVRATPPGDFFNETRRAFQAEFTVQTARQALAASDVAVFMPFILVNKADPHALVVQENVAPFPGWDAYAKFTREHPWPKRRLFAPAGERASPVVLQWSPAPRTPNHKLAGAYRVTGGEAVRGEYRVFNFGDRPVSGLLDIDRPSTAKLTGEPASGQAKMLTVPAGGHVSVPVSYTPVTSGGYFREWTGARFIDQQRRVSQVAFGLERDPAVCEMSLKPLALRRVNGPGLVQPHAVNVEGRGAAAWRVFNGLLVEPVAGEREMQRFTVNQPVNDPLAPTYAMAALDGVPANAKFLKLTLDRPMSADTFLRVDLIEENGQRFTIWEDFGNVKGAFERELWLGLEDFHPYLWSRAVPGRRTLRPDKVREVQLRVYLPRGGKLDVRLEWAIPARAR